MEMEMETKMELKMAMDFRMLARRDLQALCKKNQIPANQTNVAMADALASLEQVEGLDEFLNRPKHDEMQSPEKEKPLAAVTTRSTTRLSTRRRAALESETDQLPSHTTVRCSIRNRTTEAADKDCKVLNFAETPAALRTKKRTEKEKAEDVKNEEGDAVADVTVKTVLKTRLGKAQASVTQLTRMSTRRSTRLLERKMNDLKLTDEVAKDLEPIKMGDLGAEKDLPEESEYASKDNHPSESVKEETEAEVIAKEVETLAEVGTEIEAEGESQSRKRYEKSETVAAEAEVNAAVAIESRTTEFTDEAEAQNEVNSEDVADEVEALADVAIEIESEIEHCSTKIYGKRETAAVESDVDEPVKVDNDSKNQDSLMLATAGDDISELTAQVTSWSLEYSKEVCNKEMDALVVITDKGIADNDDIMMDGNLADTDGVSESTAEVESLDKMGELFALGLPRIEKMAETFDMKIIEGAPDAGEDSSIVRKKTPDSISKMNRVPLSPLSVARPTEVSPPLKSSSKKMQAKDENKENVENGAEFGKQKKNTTELVLTADEDNQVPTSLKDESIRKLKKMIKEKTKMQNEKRLALQTLPGNNDSTVAGEKDV